MIGSSGYKEAHINSYIRK